MPKLKGNRAKAKKFTRPKFYRRREDERRRLQQTADREDECLSPTQPLPAEPSPALISPDCIEMNSSVPALSPLLRKLKEHLKIGEAMRKKKSYHGTLLAASPKETISVSIPTRKENPSTLSPYTPPAIIRVEGSIHVSDDKGPLMSTTPIVVKKEVAFT